MITVDWPSSVIFVQKSFTTLIQSTPSEIRELDTDALRVALRDLEDSPEGRSFPLTVDYTAPKTLDNVTYAPFIEIREPYTVTFEDGQYRVVFEGSNNNILSRANVNQVSLAPQNSAGSTFSKEAQDASYTDARVYVDTVDGVDENRYPAGTPGRPVNSITNAEDIINSRGLPRRLFIIKGSITIPPPSDLQGYNIAGSSARQCEIDVNVGANTTNMVLSALSITGDINGAIDAKDSTSLVNLIDFDGRLDRCGLDGTISIGQAPGSIHEFIDCFSEVAGTGFPTLDCQDYDNLVMFFRRYSGSIAITNYSGVSNQMTVDMDSGRVIIDSSCTAGFIVVRGVGSCQDDSGPGCTVITEGLVGGTEDIADNVELLLQDQGLDQSNPKTIIENAVGVNYDEVVGGVTKEVRKSGSITTITRTT